MRRLCLLLVLLATCLLFARPARAATEVQIHLLVMGPGEDLYTRGGHAALVVAELEEGASPRTTVYNYGDTDWDDPLLAPRFLRGNLVFFLSDTGTLESTIETYGVNQGREVTAQKLNLSPDQAAEIARRLREGTVKGHREYIFHHRRAVCSTRILDLLDDVLDGQLRAQLTPHVAKETPRHYQDLVFGGSFFASVAGDLFFGRQHDRPLDGYEEAGHPDRMREVLQTVMLTTSSGAKVPLAAAPEQLVARTEPMILQQSWLARGLWVALTLVLLGTGAAALRRVRTSPVPAAKVVFWAALVSGILGTMIAAFIAFSMVPELRQNELILVLWPTDLWLAWRMRRVARGAPAPDKWTRAYTHARLATAALLVVGHLTGVLYQEPRLIAALGCLVACVSWVLVRSMRRASVKAREPERRTELIAEA